MREGNLRCFVKRLVFCVRVTLLSSWCGDAVFSKSFVPCSCCVCPAYINVTVYGCVYPPDPSFSPHRTWPSYLRKTRQPLLKEEWPSAGVKGHALAWPGTSSHTWASLSMTPSSPPASVSTASPQSLELLLQSLYTCWIIPCDFLEPLCFYLFNLHLTVLLPFIFKSLFSNRDNFLWWMQQADLPNLSAKRFSSFYSLPQERFCLTKIVLHHFAERTKKEQDSSDSSRYQCLVIH